MVSWKVPATPMATWWRCGGGGDNNSPLSGTGASVVIMVDEHLDPPARDPKPPSVTTPPRLATSIQGMRSLVHGIVSPIRNCVTPPISMCTTALESRQNHDFAPWQTRQNQQQSGDYFIYMPASSHQESDVSSQKLHWRCPSSLPLENIETCHVHCNDVLCGRSSSTTHVGNRNFRDLVAANRNVYASLTRKQKQAFARSIVDLVHSTRPQGRFLMRESTTGLWNDIGMVRSIEKTSQALREVGSSLHDAGSSEDRSVAPTAASESLASVSTTPASNNSHPARQSPQVVVPQHLQHVYRTNHQRSIPSHVNPRMQGLSLERDMATAAAASLDTATPVSPEPPLPTQTSLRGSLSFPSPTMSSSSPRGPMDQYDQLVLSSSRQLSAHSEPSSPVSTPPSGPTAIWRIHKSAVSAPDIFRTSSPCSLGDCDSLKQLQLGHTLIQPAMERVSTAEWNGLVTTMGPRNSFGSSKGESDTSKTSQHHLQSALGLEERVIGRQRRSENVESSPGGCIPLPPSGVSRHRQRSYEVALSTTSFLGLDDEST